VAVRGRACAGNGFLVGDARLFGGQAGLELVLRFANGDVDMLVAHALQDSLVRGGFVIPGKGHVLFGQTGQGWADLR
jgi:hypothetical protein